MILMLHHLVLQVRFRVDCSVASMNKGVSDFFEQPHAKDNLQGVEPLLQSCVCSYFDTNVL
jgi:hypothetical protein